MTARTYGAAMKMASRMASRNATAEQIRASIRRKFGCDTAYVIRTLRARGELPEKTIKKPGVLELHVSEKTALTLIRIAKDHQACRTDVARQAIRIGLRHMQAEARA